jgi:hypothetical protein
MCILLPIVLERTMYNRSILTMRFWKHVFALLAVKHCSFLTTTTTLSLQSPLRLL